MRWLPRRGSRQHWTLRILQIAHATYLSAMFSIIALEGPAKVPAQAIWLWTAIIALAWITRLVRLGWAVTLTQIVAWFSLMILPLGLSSYNASNEPIFLLAAAVITGFMIGLVLDLCHFGERLELSGSSADSTPVPNDQ
jgi:hypothetical protein